MAFKMKSGPKGPMKKNFPGAFKLKDGDEVEKNTRDVKNPVKNPRKYPKSPLGALRSGSKCLKRSAKRWILNRRIP